MANFLSNKVDNWVIHIKGLGYVASQPRAGLKFGYKFTKNLQNARVYKGKSAASNSLLTISTKVAANGGPKLNWDNCTVKPVVLQTFETD